MQRLSYPTETVLTNEITRNRIVLSFKDSLRKPLGRRPGKRERERERDGKGRFSVIPVDSSSSSQ